MNKSGEVQSEIASEWKVVQDAWHDVQAGWKDAVASQYGKRFMEPLESQMPEFLAKLRSLDHEIQKALREIR